jgi:ATP-dependent protease ClpP protease subunit
MAGAAEIARLLAASSWGSKIVAEVDHLCYSAAAVILLPVACRVVMRENATLMLHEPSRLFWGRASDCLRIAREQRRSDEADWRQLAAVRKIPYSRVRRVALAEHFLSASEALRLGFVDEISPALPDLNTKDPAP